MIETYLCNRHRALGGPECAICEDRIKAISQLDALRVDWRGVWRARAERAEAAASQAECLAEARNRRCEELITERDALRAQLQEMGVVVNRLRDGWDATHKQLAAANAELEALAEAVEWAAHHNTEVVFRSGRYEAYVSTSGAFYGSTYIEAVAAARAALEGK